MFTVIGPEPAELDVLAVQRPNIISIRKRAYIVAPTNRLLSVGRGVIFEDTSARQGSKLYVWFWQFPASNADLMAIEAEVEKLRVRPPAGAGSLMFQSAGSIATSGGGRLVYKWLDKTLALPGGLFSLWAQ